MKVKLDLVDLFHKNSRSESFQTIFWADSFVWEGFEFFGGFFLSLHTPHQWVAVMHHVAVCQSPINNIRKKKCRSGLRDTFLSSSEQFKEVMSKEGADKPRLTAAEEQLIRHRKNLDFWKKNAAQIRTRNLLTGLSIGAFVVGICILHRSLKE